MYCPHCKSTQEMVKFGFDYSKGGKSHQRWLCKNKKCGKSTTLPLKVLR